MQCVRACVFAYAFNGPLVLSNTHKYLHLPEVHADRQTDTETDTNANANTYVLTQIQVHMSPDVS